MIRGLWNHAGVLYSVENNGLFSIDSAGRKNSLGLLNSGAGNVDFASNLTQLCINDGSYLYVYSPSSGILTTAANYPGGDRISFLDQRVNFQFRGTQQFGWTAAGDATSIGILDFASAETSPDLLVSQLVAERELWLFGIDSTEIWDPTTATDAAGGPIVYTRSSAAIDYGCCAPFSAQQTANAVVWLSQGKGGQAMVLSATGHQARRISNRAIEEKLQGLNLSGSKAFTYSDGGLSFYCLNVPGLDTTLVWEETFSQWHERAEIYTGYYSKWRPTCHAFVYGKHYFGTDDGTLYTADANVYLFGSDPIKRERTAPVISDPSHERIPFDLFELICEQGTGATVMMQYSDDNGRNWSDWQYTTVGDAGQFAHRARFRRLGAAFDRVFRTVMTDNAPFNPVSVNWK